MGKTHRPAPLSLPARTCGRPRRELGVEVEGVLWPAHRRLEGRLDLLPVQLLRGQQDRALRASRENAGGKPICATCQSGASTRQPLPEL